MTTAILIGPPGAGKSTVGPLLAALLGVAFLDTDSVIEAAAGKPVGDIFIQDGEAAFRALERTAVAEAVEGYQGVLALGGGAVLDPGTQRLLAGQRVVYLQNRGSRWRRGALAWTRRARCSSAIPGRG